MKTPPFLISAALLFWGWQTGLLPLAACCAAAIEAQRFLNIERDVTRAEWGHLADICTIILLAILVAGFVRDKTRIAYDIGKWLPVILFPLLIAQRYSAAGKVDLSALSLLARRKKTLSHRLPPADIQYPYLLFCMLSAGFSKTASPLYFWGLCMLGISAAAGVRSRRVPALRWLVLLLMAGTLGFAFHTGLYRLQQRLIAISDRFFDADVNPLKTTTAIGDIGLQKLSDGIVFRASSDTLPSDAGPLRLHEASYNAYRSGSWYALKTTLVPSWQSSGDHPVRLSSRPEPETQTLEIQTRVRRGKSVLKLPGGTFRLDLLPRCSVLTNALGSVVIRNVEPKMIRYRAEFSPNQPIESPPGAIDLDVPETEREVIERFAKELNLNGLSPDKVVRMLTDCFNTEFSYTLEHRGKGRHKTPLAHFLLGRKAGQCELFATSTVLILRSCGIPARYAVGYVAQEYSPLEQQFIIRHRHGHAWVRVFLDGHWQDLDTTPSNWLALEEEKQSPFQFISDFASFISFGLSRLRWSQQDYLGKLAIGLLVILILLIANRLRKQKKNGRNKTVRRQKRIRKSRAQKETELERLEKEIAKKGWPRNPGEALIPWAHRVQQAAPDLLSYSDLHTSIQRHYQQRFGGGDAADPAKPLVDALIASLRE